MELLRLDALGNTLWTRELTEVGINDATVTQAGTWVLAGSVHDSADSALLIEVDMSGTLLRAQGWGGPSLDLFSNADALGSDMLLVQVFSPNGFLGQKSAALVRLDASWGGIPCAGTPLDLTLVPSTHHTKPTTGLVVSDIPLLRGRAPPGHGHAPGSDRLLPRRLGDWRRAAPGSQGALCLSGAAIGRWSNEIKTTGENGTFSLHIELVDLPGLGAVNGARPGASRPGTGTGTRPRRPTSRTPCA